MLRTYVFLPVSDALITPVLSPCITLSQARTIRTSATCCPDLPSRLCSQGKSDQDWLMHTLCRTHGNLALLVMPPCCCCHFYSHCYCCCCCHLCPRAHPSSAHLYMCMCMCMYVCIYVCMYVCMHVCMYVCILCVYVCMCVCMYSCIYVCIHAYEPPPSLPSIFPPVASCTTPKKSSSSARILSTRCAATAFSLPASKKPAT